MQVEAKNQLCDIRHSTLKRFSSIYRSDSPHKGDNCECCRVPSTLWGRFKIHFHLPLVFWSSHYLISPSEASWLLRSESEVITDCSKSLSSTSLWVQWTFSELFLTRACLTRITTIVSIWETLQLRRRFNVAIFVRPTFGQELWPPASHPKNLIWFLLNSVP